VYNGNAGFPSLGMPGVAVVALVRFSLLVSAFPFLFSAPTSISPAAEDGRCAQVAADPWASQRAICRGFPAPVKALGAGRFRQAWLTPALARRYLNR